MCPIKAELGTVSVGLKWCTIPFVLEFNKERMAEDDMEIALQDRAETWQQCSMHIPGKTVA